MSVDKLDVGKVTIQKYVDYCMGELPESLNGVLDDFGTSQLYNVFATSYILKRNELLESNCLALYRKYLAAWKALTGWVGEDKANDLYKEALKELPDHITEIPDHDRSRGV